MKMSGKIQIDNRYKRKDWQLKIKKNELCHGNHFYDWDVLK